MQYSRNTLLNAIYHATPRDYRGHVDGFKAILLYCGGDGTCLVRLIDLDDAEIAKLVQCKKAQAYLARR